MSFTGDMQYRERCYSPEFGSNQASWPFWTFPETPLKLWMTPFQSRVPHSKISAESCSQKRICFEIRIWEPVNLPPRCCLWIVPWNWTLRDLGLDFLLYEICQVELNSIYSLNYRSNFFSKGRPILPPQVPTRVSKPRWHSRRLSRALSIGRQATWFLKTRHHTYIKLGAEPDAKEY